MGTKEAMHNKDFAASNEIEHTDDTHVTFEAIEDAEERQVVQKLDLHVLPLMTLVYFCMCKSLFSLITSFLVQTRKQVG